MVYFSNGQITIRNMECKDAQAITDAEIEQGWDATIEKYQKIGRSTIREGNFIGCRIFWKPVGYINIYPNSAWGSIWRKRLPGNR